VGGECNTYPGVPADTKQMDGTFGQRITLVQSRDAVIVRLGWTIAGKSQFDGCQLESHALAK
jgi:hypothetical protein